MSLKSKRVKRKASSPVQEPRDEAEVKEVPHLWELEGSTLSQEAYYPGGVGRQDWDSWADFVLEAIWESNIFYSYPLVDWEWQFHGQNCSAYDCTTAEDCPDHNRLNLWFVHGGHTRVVLSVEVKASDEPAVRQFIRKQSNLERMQV